MSSRSQGIRETIQLLSTILSHCGLPRVPSESFRQAKFNKPEAINTFWTLLIHTVQTVQFLECDGCGCTPDSIQRIPEQKFKHAVLEVRRYLFMLGYIRGEFYGSYDSVGSRELLLGFAWLVEKCNLFAKLRWYHLNAGNEVCVPLKPSRKFMLEHVEKGAESFRNEVRLLLKNLSLSEENEDTETLRQNLQKLMWLRGKIFCCWKSMLNAHHAYQKLANQLHKYTIRAPQHALPSHLTVHELFLLRYPDQLALHLKQVEHHVLALQKLAEWQYHEPTFWQWMESVLDLQEKEDKEEKALCTEVEQISNEGKTKGEEAENCPCLSAETLSVEVRRLEREVLRLLQRSKPHSDKVHHVWRSKERHLDPEKLQRELQVIDKGLLSPYLSTEKSHTDPGGLVQTLKPFDSAVYIPDVTAQKHKIQPYAFPSLVQKQQEVSLRLLEASNTTLAQVEKELARLDENIQKLRSDISKQLQTLLAQLPPSVCKINYNRS